MGNMENGWIKLHRKLTNWQWYQDSKTFHLFLHLLLMANHQPKKWMNIVVERGQVIMGRHKLSEQTGISEQSIRTSLEKLKSTSEVTIKSTNRYSIITICNYNDYQNDKKQINQQINQQLNQPSTSHQPATNHKQEYKDFKNDNNKEKNKEIVCGEFNNVKLTEPEYQKLLEKFKEEKTKELIERLSTGIASKGYRYKSHYATILNWERKKEQEKPKTWRD